MLSRLEKESKLMCRMCGSHPAEVCEDCMRLYKQTRKMRFNTHVWKRAHNKCEECGETNATLLNIHHLDKEQYPYNVKYAILLCIKCHARRHGHNLTPKAIEGLVKGKGKK